MINRGLLCVNVNVFDIKFKYFLFVALENARGRLDDGTEFRSGFGEIRLIFKQLFVKIHLASRLVRLAIE